MRVRAPYFTASMTTCAHELRGRRIGDKRVHGVLDEVRRTNLKGSATVLSFKTFSARFEDGNLMVSA